MKLTSSFEISKEEIQIILTSVTTTPTLKALVAIALLAVIAFWLLLGRPGI